MKDNKIEKIEQEIYEEIFFLIKSQIKKIEEALNSKNNLLKYWVENWKGKTKMAPGMERVFYALFDWKIQESPNSNPVSSDIFFERKNAFVHIDLKAYTKNNSNDYYNNMPIGNNQNSLFNIKFLNSTQKYSGNLPFYYNKKPTISIFIEILSNSSEADSVVEELRVFSVPNGQIIPYLEDRYNKEFFVTSGKRGSEKGTARINNKILEEFCFENGEKRVRDIKINE